MENQFIWFEWNNLELNKIYYQYTHRINVLNFLDIFFLRVEIDKK